MNIKRSHSRIVPATVPVYVLQGFFSCGKQRVRQRDTRRPPTEPAPPWVFSKPSTVVLSLLLFRVIYRVDYML
jgi:hypothetical protein